MHDQDLIGGLSALTTRYERLINSGLHYEQSLTSEPQRRVGALAAAAREEHLREPVRQPALDEAIAQREASGCRPQRDDVGATVHRGVHGVGDLRATPPDVADDRAAGAIEDPAPIGREEVGAVAADDRRPRGRVRDEGEVVGVGTDEGAEGAAGGIGEPTGELLGRVADLVVVGRAESRRSSCSTSDSPEDSTSRSRRTSARCPPARRRRAARLDLPCCSPW